MKWLIRVLRCVCVAALILVVLLSAAVQFQQRKNHFTVAETTKLKQMFGEADRLAVFSTNGLSVGRQIYASNSSSDLAALNASIGIDKLEQIGVCACTPLTVIRLFTGEKEIGELDIFGGDTIRFSKQSLDARIVDTKPWFQWLDARGIRAPRIEYEQGIAQGQKNRAEEERWVKAMPSSLRHLWPPHAKVADGEYETAPLEAELLREFPDKRARVLKLMAWYGSGAGPWSGYPAYENVAQQMLLKYSTPELMDAVANATLSEEESEGAARLFAGWDFNRSRPQDHVLLPEDLKRHLLEHSLKSTDEDKRARARHWLAPE